MPDIKLFTMDQAERALPLVGRIAGDISRKFKARDARVDDRMKLPRSPNPGTSAEDACFEIEAEIETLEHDIVRHINELNAIGAELKDPRIGLLDFYSRYEGRIVYLCWKLGEGDKLQYWHDLQSGFRGRQLITPDNRSLFTGNRPGEKVSIVLPE